MATNWQEKWTDQALEKASTLSGEAQVEAFVEGAAQAAGGSPEVRELAERLASYAQGQAGTEWTDWLAEHRHSVMAIVEQIQTEPVPAELAAGEPSETSKDSEVAAILADAVAGLIVEKICAVFDSGELEEDPELMAMVNAELAGLSAEQRASWSISDQAIEALIADVVEDEELIAFLLQRAAEATSESAG